MAPCASVSVFCSLQKTKNVNKTHQPIPGICTAILGLMEPHWITSFKSFIVLASGYKFGVTIISWAHLSLEKRRGETEMLWILRIRAEILQTSHDHFVEDLRIPAKGLNSQNFSQSFQRRSENTSPGWKFSKLLTIISKKVWEYQPRAEILKTSHDRFDEDLRIPAQGWNSQNFSRSFRRRSENTSQRLKFSKLLTIILKKVWEYQPKA